MKHAWMIAGLLLAAQEAHADLERQSAAEVQGAPLPGNESGRVDREGGDSAARKVGRAALFLPRIVFQIAMAPIRGSVWAFDRYSIVERSRRLFFNPEGTFGLSPSVRFESGYGLDLGASLYWQFGTDDRLKLFAGGGMSRRIAEATVRTGYYLDDRLAVEVRGLYEKLPQERFYGTGNGDVIDAPVMLGLDATDQAAIKTFYSKRLVRGALSSQLDLTEHAQLRAAAAVAGVERSPSDDGPAIDAVFEPQSLIAFDDYHYGYFELELRWDSRGRNSDWEVPKVMSNGWFAAGFVGRQVLEDSEDLWRYGLDLQWYHRLAKGPRALSARFHGEGVDVERDDVPFTELPLLGGSRWLRGYPIDRFRDRVAAVGTLEYQWDLAQICYASLFVDAGRVYPSLSDLTFDGLRVGYGVALEAHSLRRFFARLSLASSIDGGVFVNLYFDPVFDSKPRVERR